MFRQLLMCLRDGVRFARKIPLIGYVIIAAKNAFRLKKINNYTTRSVKKIVCLNELFSDSSFLRDLVKRFNYRSCLNGKPRMWFQLRESFYGLR